ncbi:hypothetical protein [Neorhodopirellula pilleata]|nr:hypothetical protein [Neorhodopirellula pilleata]
MNWFPRTTNPWHSATAMRAMALGTAIASSAFLPYGGEAFGQQRQSLQHDGQSFTVVQASEALSMMSPPATSKPGSPTQGPTIQASNHLVTPPGEFPIQLVGHGLMGDCDEGACDSTGSGAGGRLFGNLMGNRRSSSGACSSGTCSNGACSGNCSGACSTGGNCYGGACNACPTCVPYRYARVEAVYMRREGLSNFTRSQNFALDEYDFEWAPRVTIGSVPDCVNGTEVSFVGPLNWDMSNSIANATGQTLLSELIPGVTIGSPIPEQTIGFTLLYDPEDVTLDVNGDIVAFNDSPLDAVDIQRQRYESTYWSAETSQTMMAWDIAKFSFGGRFISFEEEYSYIAQNGNGATPNLNGAIASNTTNNLIGLQVGLDIFTPVFVQNLSSTLRAKAGGYWNMSEGSAVVTDQGERLSGFSDEDGTLAAMFEISSGLHYRLGEALSIHGGSEFWYLTEVATAERQLPGLVGARVGSRGVDNGDDVVFVGFSFGATLQF